MNSGGGDGERERELDIQGRLAECGDAGETLRENGKAGNGQSRTVTRAHSSSPRMLVGLDILCLIVGKIVFYEFCSYFMSFAYPVTGLIMYDACFYNTYNC